MEWYIKGLTLFSRLVESSAQAALEKTEYYVYSLEIYFQVVTETCAYFMNIDSVYFWFRI